MEEVLARLGAGGWEVPVIIAGAMVTVILAAAGLRAALGRGRDEVRERLERATGGGSEGARGGAGAGSGSGSGSGGLLARLARPFAWATRPTRAAELSRLRLRLAQAGLRSDHAMELFLATKVVMAATVTLAFLHVNSRLAHGLRFPMDAAVAVWTCGAAFLLPSLWLGGRIRDRQVTIQRALPDAMDLMVTCVEAGLGLDAALARVSDEMSLAAPLLGSELKLTFLEVQAGIARRDAFRRLADRTGVEDLRQLSAVLTQTEIFGTSVARALRVHADGMRVKRMQRAEEKAGMVGVKMTFPLVLCILPSLVAVVMGPALAAIFEHLIKPGR